MTDLGARRVEQSNQRRAPPDACCIRLRTRCRLPTDNGHVARPVDLSVDRGECVGDGVNVINKDDCDDGGGRSLLRASGHRSSFWDRLRNKAIFRPRCCPAALAERAWHGLWQPSPKRPISRSSSTSATTTTSTDCMSRRTSTRSCIRSPASRAPMAGDGGRTPSRSWQGLVSSASIPRSASETRISPYVCGEPQGWTPAPRCLRPQPKLLPLSVSYHWFFPLPTMPCEPRSKPSRVIGSTFRNTSSCAATAIESRSFVMPAPKPRSLRRE